MDFCMAPWRLSITPWLVFSPIVPISTNCSNQEQFSSIQGCENGPIHGLVPQQDQFIAIYQVEIGPDSIVVPVLDQFAAVQSSKNGPARDVFSQQDQSMAFADNEIVPILRLILE